MARIVINVIDRITGSGLQRYTVFVYWCSVMSTKATNIKMLHCKLLA